MSDKQVQRIMRSLADEKAPEATIHLWPAIKERIMLSERKPRRTWGARLRLAGAALGLAVLLTGVVFLLTPQGQAWAQNAFQFFNKIESDSVPFDSFQATQSSGSEEGATETPYADGTNPEQESNLMDVMSLEEVQSVVEYKINQPSLIPDGFTFTKAYYIEESNLVFLVYSNGDETLCIMQELISPTEPCELCFTLGIGADMKEVLINGVEGEYVEGILLPEEGNEFLTVTVTEEWDDDDHQQALLWEAAGMKYRIIYSGSSPVAEEKLIAVAESIALSYSESTSEAGDADLISEGDLDLDSLTLEEVETLAGYHIYQPSWMPLGYEFTKALYDPQTQVVTLMYYYYDQVSPALGLKMEPVSASGTCDLCPLVGSSARIQKVSINGEYGEYVEGVWTLEDGEAVWKSYSYFTSLKHLIWEADGMIFELSYMGNLLMEDDLIEIAETVQ